MGVSTPSSSIYSAGHDLNPEYYYFKPEIENNGRLVKGLCKCIETLNESYAVEDLISEQLSQYRGDTGLFGIRAAIRQRSTLAPAKWWKSYGAETLKLQLLAVKVLSLSCSASGCERNWSIFQHIHSKKRNKLEHQRLQDLVFIKYNQALVERFEIQDKIDLMKFNEINFHTEWLMGEMENVGDDGEDLIHPNHDLNWSQVVDASGANESIIYIRRTTRQLEVGSTSQATTAPITTISPRATMTPRAPMAQQVVEDVEEVEDEELKEEVEEVEDEDWRNMLKKLKMKNWTNIWMMLHDFYVCLNFHMIVLSLNLNLYVLNLD
ncbi:unnamed protein product [Vicia faba]|uniref:HAT C-terminal dimerisation domain-containing protein n=1 Tax=Vicia faba TaxID=3906 RepID=A0AAV0YTZ5_VICFA|nr:unnamed protein product [Vicia faba]